MTTAEQRRADIIDLLLDDHRTVVDLFDSFDLDLGIERLEGSLPPARHDARPAS